MSMVVAGVLTAGLMPTTAAAHGGGDDDNKDRKLTSEQRKLVKTLKDVTEEYRSLAEAKEDGYKKVTPCVAKKGVGAMGFHYAKNSLIDGKTDPRKPEVLVYMPNRDGKYKLVAVEFLRTPDLGRLDQRSHRHRRRSPPRSPQSAEPRALVRRYRQDYDAGASAVTIVPQQASKQLRGRTRHGMHYVVCADSARQAGRVEGAH
jgi:hypothetical protein